MAVRRQALIALAILIAGSVAARAQDDDLVLRQAATIAGESMFAGSGAVGMVLAVVRGDYSYTIGFGKIAAGSNVTPDGKTIVRLGSISKAMTGQILANVTLARLVSLSDPLQIYLPDVKVPEFHGRKISLLDLATHTAGLPRDVPDPNVNCPSDNPFCGYTASYYNKWLGGYRLDYQPGTVASYSNAGFGFLGEALSKATGQTFAQMLEARVTRSAGMSDTVVKLSDDQKKRFMTGYDNGAAVSAKIDGSEVMQPSGGVFSTANDMAQWLKYNIAVTSGWSPDAGIAQAIYIPRQRLNAVIALDAPDRPLDGLGLGWEINLAIMHRPLIIQKTGAFLGFMGYVAFAPGRNVGVFFALNRIDVPILFNLMGQANQLIAGLATR